MKTLAPYQIFFPIGILSSLLAVGVWFTKDLNWFQAPAMLIHAKLIAGGFLWSFIIGFLMTAAPKMTGTNSAKTWELFIALALIFTQILSCWNIDARWFYGTTLILISFLIIFLGRRALSAKKSFPVFFFHVGIAIVLALLGSYYHFIGNSFMGIHLYHVGAVLLLVLGIGTRFFSFLSGL
ncbi:MAG: NnrS family protein, partial [Pseudobdellovibrio sp.]